MLLPSINGEHLADNRACSEHIWRKHTRFYRCGFCELRWSISTSRTQVSQKKAEHWESCDGKRRNAIYPDPPDEDTIELLNWKQEEKFKKVKSIKDVGAKLEALYKVCGKPVPETYRW